MLPKGPEWRGCHSAELAPEHGSQMGFSPLVCGPSSQRARIEEAWAPCPKSMAYGLASFIHADALILSASYAFEIVV